ncbi:hypothetical protein ACP4OV_024195 [Aristida adscensionis]
MASLEPFNRLVRLAARAFYADVSLGGGGGSNKPSPRGADDRGVAVVVLDALTRRRQWVREDDLAKQLGLHSKHLRRVLRFLEEDKLLARDHRREASSKRAKPTSAAADKPPPAPPSTDGGDEREKAKLHTHSYCALDHAQILDVVRYRLHRMRRKLKDELDSRDTVQRYVCPRCGRRYSAFDALQLVSYADDYFHCEACDGELVAAAEKPGDCADTARRHRREKLRDMQRRMGEQLAPLVSQLERVKDLPAPEFQSLRSWERATLAADSLRSSQGQFGASMPYMGQTNSNSYAVQDIQVQILPDAVKEGVSSSADGASMKVLPPWMIRHGMNLTEEQRGEPSSSSSTLKKEDESETKYDLKAHYEALRKVQEGEAKMTLQQETEERQVGKKHKREDEDYSLEWEEEQHAGLADVNVQAQESGDEDGFEWEEG